ncbi:aminotransferase class I/II-fold pyridoxal phosphate-dependent enzyme [Actinokineospora sp. PR83]|nr:aminotransferase class I/II-fold pyridoxal phosphate-dependent enzyme [Actinokineospora sp. PR83]MCG8914438.1 aminotransferase class I/II-fold pyridoxal phosphate-dependent enzyme [Actinokineospora sp. PR83]
MGPSKIAVERVIAAAQDLHRYPGHLRRSATAAVAEYQGVPEDATLLTSGVDEAVDLVLSTTHTAWTTSPGFTGYADRARALGKRVRTIVLDERWEPATDPAELRDGVVLLAQPNNPTGNTFGPDWLHAVLRDTPLVFLDETYLRFGPAPVSRAARAPHTDNLLVYSSFSKSFGLAGVRLGAVFGSQKTIRALRAAQRYEAVDTVALAAAEGVLADRPHLADLRRCVVELRPRYAEVLATADLFDHVRETEANFVLARCRTPAGAGGVVAGLAALGVRVCDTAAFGLPGWVRVSVGTSRSLHVLAQALTELDHRAAGGAADLNTRTQDGETA